MRMPPDCSLCRRAVGLWEPIALSLDGATAMTTWLQLPEHERRDRGIWHEQCVEPARILAAEST